MELSEGFKNVVATIKALEQQIIVCRESLTICDTSAQQVEEEIDAFFARCENYLAARKAALLVDLTQKVINHKQCVEGSREKLESSIAACKQTLSAGALVFELNKTAAEIVWMGIKSVSFPQVIDARITIDLPPSLLNTIKTYGKVVVPEASLSPSLVPFPASPPSQTRSAAASYIKPAMVLSRARAISAGSSIEAGLVTTLATQLSYPHGICLNTDDNCLYVCDSSSDSIKKLTLQGNVSTFASGGLKGPRGIAINQKESIFYVTTATTHSISSISAFAGSAKKGYIDSFGASASFNHPLGIAVDQLTGIVYICDHYNSMIRAITPQGGVSTLAGSLLSGFADGVGPAAKFNRPWGICYDDFTNSLIVCDYDNDKLRRVQLGGEVSTLCEVPRPTYATISATRTILVASHSNCIYKVTQIGTKYKATVLAGSGRGERVDGMPNDCSFNIPFGIAVHETSRSCFVSDFGGQAVRKITLIQS